MSSHAPLQALTKTALAAISRNHVNIESRVDVLAMLSSETSTRKSRSARDRVSHRAALQITDKGESFYTGITIMKHISHVRR